MSDVVPLPRRRTGRVSPPSLRPAPTAIPQGPDLSRLLARFHPILPTENDQ